MPKMFTEPGQPGIKQKKQEFKGSSGIASENIMKLFDILDSVKIHTYSRPHHGEEALKIIEGIKDLYKSDKRLSDAIQSILDKNKEVLHELKEYAAKDPKELKKNAHEEFVQHLTRFHKLVTDLNLALMIVDITDIEEDESSLEWKYSIEKNSKMGSIEFTQENINQLVDAFAEELTKFFEEQILINDIDNVEDIKVDVKLIDAQINSACNYFAEKKVGESGYKWKSYAKVSYDEIERNRWSTDEEVDMGEPDYQDGEWTIEIELIDEYIQLRYKGRDEMGSWEVEPEDIYEFAQQSMKRYLESFFLSE